MTTEKIYEQLNLIFRELFDNDSITVSPETTADDIEDWDSLEHINLILAIEQSFEMKFSMGEVTDMKNVGEMVNIIAGRCKK